MQKSTYAATISRLNSCNLAHALEYVCLLSVLESEGGLDSPIFPLLNSEQVRLLAEAVIKSKAAWYKDQQIRIQDLSILLNGATDALRDGRLEQEVISGGERQRMLYNLQRYFARSAYIQIRPQRTSWVALGRTLAILEIIPTSHADEFEPRIQQQITRFPECVRDILGMSVRDLVRTHLYIGFYFEQLGRALLRKLPTKRPGQYLSAEWKTRVLGQLLLSSSDDLQRFRMTSLGLSQFAGEQSGNLLDQYAKVFGRSVSVHRHLLNAKDYQIGPDGHRLSPLDRFPLVADENSEAWYIPNVRLLARSAPEILHFTLNENARKEYEEFRGWVLEVYLRLMFKNRAPQLVVVPEAKWMSPKGEVRGPDLLIIDHSDDPAVIAVEVKSKRMVTRTRFELSDGDLTQNYEGLWKALKVLPEKTTKALNLLGEYKNHEEDLSRARSYPVYYLGVVGEAPFLFGEMTEYRRMKDSNFPLYGFNGTMGVMSVDTFECMLEVSVQNRRSIAGVLRDYLEDCKQMELSNPMAEDFRQANLDLSQSFACSFLKSVE